MGAYGQQSHRRRFLSRLMMPEAVSCKDQSAMWRQWACAGFAELAVWNWASITWHTKHSYHAACICSSLQCGKQVGNLLEQLRLGLSIVTHVCLWSTSVCHKARVHPLHPQLCLQAMGTIYVMCSGRYVANLFVASFTWNLYTGKFALMINMEATHGQYSCSELSDIS